MFVEALGGYTVKPRQVVIQDDLLPTEEQNDLLDSLSWYEVLHALPPFKVTICDLKVRPGLTWKSYLVVFDLFWQVARRDHLKGGHRGPPLRVNGFLSGRRRA